MTNKEKLEELNRKVEKELNYCVDYMDEEELMKAITQMLREEKERIRLERENQQNLQISNEEYNSRMPDCN